MIHLHLYLTGDNIHVHIKWTNPSYFCLNQIDESLTCEFIFLASDSNCCSILNV